MVGSIEFVETRGDLASYYVRFADREGDTLLRAYLPRPIPSDSAKSGGNPEFAELRAQFVGHEGVESVRREVYSPARE